MLLLVYEVHTILSAASAMVAIRFCLLDYKFHTSQYGPREFDEASLAWTNCLDCLVLLFKTTCFAATFIRQPSFYMQQATDLTSKTVPKARGALALTMSRIMLSARV